MNQLRKRSDILYFLFLLVAAYTQLGFSTGTGGGQKPTFSDGKLVRDVDHMKKELSGLVDIAIENISYEHMEFYYFRLHDFNKDEHLDGNELFQALTESSIKMSNHAPPHKKEIEEYFGDAVDTLLAETDTDGDGLISWKEYLSKTRSFADL